MGQADLFRYFALLALDIFGEYGSDERDEDAILCLLFMAKEPKMYCSSRDFRKRLTFYI